MQTLLSVPMDTKHDHHRTVLAQSRAMAPAGVKNPLWFGLSERLITARMAADLSMSALTARCEGMNSASVSNVENAMNCPLVSTVERLACALGVCPVWLAFGHEGAEPFAERVRRSLLRVPKDPRPGQPQPCPEAYRGLPARITLAREALGLSMRQLGLTAGLSGPAVEKMEKGRSVPRLDNVEALAKALGVSPGWLAFGVGRGPDGRKHKPAVLMA